jgi:hypothetical protein
LGVCTGVFVAVAATAAAVAAAVVIVDVVVIVVVIGTVVVYIIVVVDIAAVIIIAVILSSNHHKYLAPDVHPTTNSRKGQLAQMLEDHDLKQRPQDYKTYEQKQHLDHDPACISPQVSGSSCPSNNKAKEEPAGTNNCGSRYKQLSQGCKALAQATH